MPPDDQNVRRLHAFILQIGGLDIRPRVGPCYAHMGATICDSILQAGLNYRTVVAPRIQRLIQQWPASQVTSRFMNNVTRFGVHDVLIWNHPEKPERILQLGTLLRNEQVETEFELAQWLDDKNNCESLQTVRGIGPKTVDYLKSLAGLPAVAVDRHIRTFVSWAGLELRGYQEISDVVGHVADRLSVERNALDHAIWSYVSSSRNRQVEQYRARAA